MDINGKGLKYEFEVRKFSNTAILPYDIVFKDYRENMKYSDPNLVFDTAQEAQAYADKLSKKYLQGTGPAFIINKWNTEGTL